MSLRPVPRCREAQRLILARRQLRKTTNSLAATHVLPAATCRELQTLAEDCAIAAASVIERLAATQRLAEDAR
jgi:hypothetical protein